jgi:hypothetical protein
LVVKPDSFYTKKCIDQVFYVTCEWEKNPDIAVV